MTEATTHPTTIMTAAIDPGYCHGALCPPNTQPLVSPTEKRRGWCDECESESETLSYDGFGRRGSAHFRFGGE